MSFAARAQERQHKTLEQQEAAYKSSVKNTLRTLAETEEISMNTAVTLNAQTEQLHRIHNTTEDMNHTLDTTQYLLNGMKTWWGRAKNSFRGPPEREPTNASPSAPIEARAVPSISTATSFPSRQPAAPGTSEREDDKDLDQILGMLDTLKARTQDIGRTIQTQTGLVGKIASNVETADSKIAKQNTAIKSLC